MPEMGFVQDSVKWGGKDYSRKIWVRQGCSVYRGILTLADGQQYDLAEHLEIELDETFGMFS